MSLPFAIYYDLNGHVSTYYEDAMNTNTFYTSWTDKSSFFIALAKVLPPVFTRETASQSMGGIFSAKTLSNLDANNAGPRIKIKIGKKVAYEKNDFIMWLRNKLSSD